MTTFDAWRFARFTRDDRPGPDDSLGTFGLRTIVCDYPVPDDELWIVHEVRVWIRSYANPNLTTTGDLLLQYVAQREASPTGRPQNGFSSRELYGEEYRLWGSEVRYGDLLPPGGVASYQPAGPGALFPPRTRLAVYSSAYSSTLPPTMPSIVTTVSVDISIFGQPEVPDVPGIVRAPISSNWWERP